MSQVPDSPKCDHISCVHGTCSHCRKMKEWMNKNWRYTHLQIHVGGQKLGFRTLWIPGISHMSALTLSDYKLSIQTLTNNSYFFRHLKNTWRTKTELIVGWWSSCMPLHSGTCSSHKTNLTQPLHTPTTALSKRDHRFS